MNAPTTVRRLDNWLDSFVEYAQAYNTPERYRKWAGLWTLATAAKRSIGMNMPSGIMPPNMYVILVGGPGTGKSQVCSAVSSVLLPATGYNMIPPSITRAGMEDYMQGNMKTRKAPDGKLLISNECIGLADEMQGILPDQDLGHLTLYNRLYDNPPNHKAVTRSNGEVKLESPYCALLTGAQPSFLSLTLPEQAWGMGFMSRSVMVWGVAPPRRSVFKRAAINPKLKSDLIHDLKHIFNSHFYMTWTTAAEQLYDTWWVEHGGNPIPKHKRLAMGYNSRREFHMMKLAMTHSLAESDEPLVEERHVLQAIATLIDAESQMHFIFNEMTSTGSTMALEDVIDYVRINTANDRDTAEADIITILMQRFPSTQVHHHVENLISSGALKSVGGANVKGMRRFRLGAKVGIG